MYGWQDIFSGCILAVAFCAAACMKAQERREAMLCVVTLIAVWVIYTASWDAELNLAIFATKHGFPLRTGELWTVMDLFAGLIAITTAWRFWWGLTLYGSFMIETAAHWLRWQMHIMDRVPYYWTLDACFYAQAALFLAMGGPNAAEYITRFFGSSRSLLPVRHGLSSKKSVTRV
jgi:hypothetical protein